MHIMHIVNRNAALAVPVVHRVGTSWEARHVVDLTWRSALIRARLLMLSWPTISEDAEWLRHVPRQYDRDSTTSLERRTWA